LISAFYAWLEGDAPHPSLQVYLNPIRQNLLGGGAAKLVDLIWSTCPDCTPNQLAQIEPALASGQDAPLLTCRPPQPEAAILGAVTQVNQAVAGTLLRHALMVATAGGMARLLGLVNRPEGPPQPPRASQSQAAPPWEGPGSGDHPSGMFG
jgi:hypothetical protein